MSQIIRVEIVRLDPELPLPQYSSPEDAAVDLRSVRNCHMNPGKSLTIDTGIAIAVPEGYAGFITPRSGLARQGMSITNSPGIVDSGYRGEVSVLAVNLGKESILIQRGDRIAQLFILPIPTIFFEEVDELPESARGTRGFGSTGVK